MQDIKKRENNFEESDFEEVNFVNINYKANINYSDLSNLNEIIINGPDMRQLFSSINKMTEAQFEQIIMTQVRNNPEVRSYLAYFGKHIINRKHRNTFVKYLAEMSAEYNQALYPASMSHLTQGQSECFSHGAQILQLSYGCSGGCKNCALDAFQPRPDGVPSIQHIPLHQAKRLLQGKHEGSKFFILFASSDLGDYPDLVELAKFYEQQIGKKINITSIVPHGSENMFAELIKQDLVCEASRISVDSRRNLKRIINMFEAILVNVDENPFIEEYSQNIRKRIEYLREAEGKKDMHSTARMSARNNEPYEGSWSKFWENNIGMNFDSGVVESTRGVGCMVGGIISPTYLGTFISTKKPNNMYPQGVIFVPFKGYGILEIEENEIEKTYLREDDPDFDEDYQKMIESEREITFEAKSFIGKPIEHILSWTVIDGRYSGREAFDDYGTIMVVDRSSRWYEVSYKINSDKRYIVTGCTTDQGLLYR